MSTQVDKQPRSNKQTKGKQQARQAPGAHSGTQQAHQPPVAPAPTAMAAHAAAAREVKYEARQQRQAEARALAARRRRVRTARLVGIVALVVLAIAGWGAYSAYQEASKPGQKMAQQKSLHVQPGEAHEAYTTDPPTSGPHVASVPAWKVYTQPITNELQVHGLEDAGVVINYKPNLDKATVTQLATLATDYEGQSAPRNHVLMSPYPNLAHNIVLTAWQRMDTLDTYDYARIRTFVDAYVGIDHHEGQPGREFP